MTAEKVILIALIDQLFDLKLLDRVGMERLHEVALNLNAALNKSADASGTHSVERDINAIFGAFFKNIAV